MILRAIEVEGFRCFDRLVRVDGFAAGVNVLAGPNGSGKSTILRALRHVLVDSHALSGAQVRQSMAPWGRALHPRIRATVSHGGTDWRVEKRFLSGVFARLEREENGVFRPVAEGKEAEAAVRKMLAAEAAPKGMAAESHLGLLQVLWTPQGAPALTPWSAGVRTSLEAAFGAALRSRAGDELVLLLGKRMEEYFSPTGMVKKSSPVTALRKEVAGLEEELRSVRGQWEAAGRNREALGALRAQVARDAARLAEEAAMLRTARERQKEMGEATAGELRARQTYEALEARVKRWRDDIGLRQQCEAQLAELRAKHGKAEAELAAAQGQAPELARMEGELERLRQAGVDVLLWPEVLRARSVEAERAALRLEMAEIAAPAPPEMAQLRRDGQTLLVKEAGLAAASVRLVVEAEAALRLEIDGGERAVAEGETVEFAGPDQVTVRVPGVARFTATGGGGEAKALAAEVNALRSRMAEWLRGDTLEAVEERFSRREQLARRLEAADGEARRLAGQSKALQEVAARHPEWEAAAPEVEVLRLAWKECKAGLEAKKKQYDLAALSGAEAALQATIEERSRQLAEVAGRLAQYAAGETLEELEAKKASAQVELAMARGRVDLLRAGGAGEAGALEESVGRLEASLGAARESAARMEGELAAWQTQGLYTRMGEVEASLADKTALLDRHTRRAAALALLKETMQAGEEQLTAALPERIAEEATRNWRRIAGADAPAIGINREWTPEGFAEWGQSSTMESLSGGEAEQVTFATRLALATHLAREERQLAVFDDSFLATDAVRAGRILELLDEAAESLQILILTCHPERYGALDGVRYLDLEKLKQ